MPAYRERITLVPEQNGQPTLVVEFPFWWRRSEFFEEFGSRQIDTGSPFSVDYALLLTFGEAAAWDEHCRALLGDDSNGQEPVTSGKMAQFQELSSASRWVIVESYEWESGME